MKLKVKKTLKKWLEKGRKFYNTHRKLTLIGCGALALVIILVIGLSLTASKKDTPTTQTLAIRRGNITQSIEIVGAIRAVPSASLTWSTAGIVMPYTVAVGDIVKAGDVILELEPSSVSSDILQAQTDLVTARSNLALLKSADTAYQTAAQALANAESTYKDARNDFNSINEYGNPLEVVEASIEGYFDAREALWQAQANYEASLSSKEDNPARVAAKEAQTEAQNTRDEAFRNVNNTLGTYFGNTQEDIYLTYRSAKAALDEARVTFNAARDNSDEIAAAEAQVQALVNTINGSKIIAPFDGTVTDIFASPGDHIANGDSAIQLDNLSTMVVDVSISEVDINSVEVGDQAVITFDAIPNKVYNGIVTQVGDAGTESSGVVRFNVTVTLSDPDELVKPGFTAVTTIITDQVKDVLMVPTAAIKTLNNQKMVIVMRNGQPIPVPVTLGATSDTFSALLTGDLAEGDMVVVTIDTTNTSGLFMMGGGGGSFRQEIGQPPSDGNRPQSPSGN